MDAYFWTTWNQRREGYDVMKTVSGYFERVDFSKTKSGALKIARVLRKRMKSKTS